MTKEEERERLKERFCDDYCKWPKEYNEFREIKFIDADDLGGSVSICERVPLEESDICQNCPLRSL